MEMWNSNIPQFVTYPVMWRAMANQGGCEDWREDSPCSGEYGSELHHLHYRTVGRETPFDLLQLCRKHHDAQHRHGGRFCADPEKLAVFRIRTEPRFAHLRHYLEEGDGRVPIEALQCQQPLVPMQTARPQGLAVG